MIDRRDVGLAAVRADRACATQEHLAEVELHVERRGILISGFDAAPRVARDAALAVRSCALRAALVARASELHGEHGTRRTSPARALAEVSIRIAA